jgi:peptidyl-prolyl cis-trans isomerase C
MSLRARLAWILPLACAACAGGPPRPTPAPESLTEAQKMRPLPSPLPLVAARVNGQEISIRNVAIRVHESIELGKVSESRRNALFREALDAEVDRELLFQEAQRRGITADTVAVQRAYDRLRGHYPDETAWKNFLGSRSLDDDTYRLELRIRHTAEAMLAAEAASHQVTATEEEARALYDRTPPEAFLEKGASPQPKPPYSSVREFLLSEVRAQKHREASQRFIGSLKAKAKIEKYL